MVSPARQVAFDVLLQVHSGGYASDLLLKHSASLDSRDAGLASEIVFGCLRYQAQLDYLIDRLASPKRGPAGSPHSDRDQVASNPMPAAVATATLAPPLVTQPHRRLDPEIRIALRMGVYQLRYLDRIPAHAAVSESVELVKRAHKQSAAGLV